MLKIVLICCTHRISAPVQAYADTFRSHALLLTSFLAKCDGTVTFKVQWYNDQVHAKTSATFSLKIQPQKHLKLKFVKHCDWLEKDSFI